MTNKEYLSAESVLQWVSCITLPAVAEFRTRDHFPIDEYRPNSHDMTWKPKSPWIVYVSTAFRHRFGGLPKENIPELIERDVPTLRINGYSAISSISDMDAIEKLGGAEEVAIPLCAVYGIMEQQKDGQGGVLPTHTRGSFFLCKDATRVLRWVFVRYQSCATIEDEMLKEKHRGWYVSVADPGERIHLYDAEFKGGHVLFTCARLS